MALIAIFDSGVGGLSIYQQVKARLPNFDYVFVSDNLAFPYGEKPERELIERVQHVMLQIIQQFHPDLVVVACNTASTVVLPLLRATHSTPVVGVVPAIKPAALASQTRHIGLLATPATVKRRYTDQLIAEFAADCKITRVGSRELVEVAEQKLRGNPVDLGLIEQILEPFLDAGDCDTLVLACTHFPLLNNEIELIFKARNHPIKLIDSGVGIANRVASLLAEQAAGLDGQSTSRAVFTRELGAQFGFTQNLQQMGIAYAGVLK